VITVEFGSKINPVEKIKLCQVEGWHD